MRPSIRPLASRVAPLDILLRPAMNNFSTLPSLTLAVSASNESVAASSSLSRTCHSAARADSRSRRDKLATRDLWPHSLVASRQLATSAIITHPCATKLARRHLSSGPSHPVAHVRQPTSFLRTFSSSSLAPSLQPLSLAGMLLSKMPRLRTEDTPGRISSKTRRRPSPLFDRLRQQSLPPAIDPSTGGSGRGSPWRRPTTTAATSTLGRLISRLDTRVFSRLPRNFVLYTIIAFNVLVFSSWLYAAETLRKFSDPRPYIFLSKNFLSGLTNLRQGRWWTLVTSCVSHEELNHFLLNMVSLAFMAPPVLALTGPTTFILLYFGAGMVSSLVSILGKQLLSSTNTSQGLSGFSHGASGSVYAIMSTFACVNPTATFLIFFVIPAPAWACVSGIFAWDLWHATKSPKGKTDSAGHVGGILAGILFWKFGLRGIRL